MRRVSVFAAALLTLVVWFSLPCFAEQKKPNILVILGDDIGWANISAYNHGVMGYQTPDNTIVIYGTDNGAEEVTWPDGGTTPIKGEKGSTWGGELNARWNDWKVHFATTHGNIATDVRQAPAWPLIINLRADPYESARRVGNVYPLVWGQHLAVRAGAAEAQRISRDDTAVPFPGGQQPERCRHQLPNT
jgi:hypothetical protein